MNPTEAQQLIQNIFDTWENAKPEQAELFYSQNITGTINHKQLFSFAELKSRIEYFAAHHQGRQYTLIDSVLAGNRMALQVHYQGFDNKLQEQFDCVFACFYTVGKNQLIEKVDIISSQPFNYREAL